MHSISGSKYAAALAALTRNHHSPFHPPQLDISSMHGNLSGIPGQRGAVNCLTSRTANNHNCLSDNVHCHKIQELQFP